MAAPLSSFPPEGEAPAGRVGVSRPRAGGRAPAGESGPGPRVDRTHGGREALLPLTLQFCGQSPRTGAVDGGARPPRGPWGGAALVWLAPPAGPRPELAERALPLPHGGWAAGSRVCEKRAAPACGRRDAGSGLAPPTPCWPRGSRRPAPGVGPGLAATKALHGLRGRQQPRPLWGRRCALEEAEQESVAPCSVASEGPQCL